MQEQLTQVSSVLLLGRTDLSSNVLRAGSSSNRKCIAEQPWPVHDPLLCKDDTVTYPVQVNGKVRENIEIDHGDELNGEEEANVKQRLVELAMQTDKVKNAVGGKAIKKVIYVKGKIINIVTEK
jgi:leucyl-tRNA synthetase